MQQFIAQSVTNFIYFPFNSAEKQYEVFVTQWAIYLLLLNNQLRIAHFQLHTTKHFIKQVGT